MKNLSAFGVKKLLPLVIKGLNEKQYWRIMLANIEALVFLFINLIQINF
jgi:hypothetical protein